MVASAQNDQWVDLWDGVTGQAAGRHRVPDRYGVVDSVRFSGDNTRLVVGTRQGWVYAVDASTLKVVGKPVRVKAGTPMLGLAANGDGARALVWLDRKLQLLDLAGAGCPRPSIPGFDAHSLGLDARREGRRRGRQQPLPGRPRHGRFPGSRDLSTRDRFPGPAFAGGSGIQFSPDGERFATSGPDRVGLWDVRTA